MPPGTGEEKWPISTASLVIKKMANVAEAEKTALYSMKVKRKNRKEGGNWFKKSDQIKDQRRKRGRNDSVWVSKGEKSLAMILSVGD